MKSIFTVEHNVKGDVIESKFFDTLAAAEKHASFCEPISSIAGEFVSIVEYNEDKFIRTVSKKNI